LICPQIEAHVIVRGLRVFSDFEFEFRMALANQRMAGCGGNRCAHHRRAAHFLSSSTVREIATLNGNVSSMVPPHVEKALEGKGLPNGGAVPAECAAGLMC
jgi:pantetheine-phosphate adenylyltransferase